MKSAEKKSISCCRGHSHHSHRKLNSSTSGSQYKYVAILGSDPTKITIKRNSSASTSSSPKEHSSKLDLAKRVAKATPAVSCSSVSSKPTDAFVNSSLQQSEPISEKIKKSDGEPLDLSTKEAAANDKKRVLDSIDQCTAKKPRGTSDTQTVVSGSQTVLASTLPQSSSKKQQLSAAMLNSFHMKSANTLHQMQQLNKKFKQQVPSLPAVSFTPPIVTAMPPMPPNWLDNYEDTIMSPHTFKKYDIDLSTAEYRTVASMLHPIQINQIKQIVNPDLWKRFVNTRKEMLRSKTDDLNILSELGLDERDVMRCTHLVLNPTKDSLHTPYSDNMALLFHCTKNVTNLDNILSQGLDERLSSIFGGRLGKGIYFADDLQKSLQYDGTGRILIFAVLLGDCISVDHFPFKNALVREPEKRLQEMRNLKDLFFDSIVGRPAGYNEYVIYNRYQCCPLYEIEYKRPVVENQPTTNTIMPQNPPPFAWLPDDPSFIVQSQKACGYWPLMLGTGPVQVIQKRLDLLLYDLNWTCSEHYWPFYAYELFKKMGTLPLRHEFNGEVIAPFALMETNTEQMSIDKKLATLFTFGFCDVERNKEILAKFRNDLYQTLNYLLDDENFPSFMVKGNQLATSTVAAVTNIQATIKKFASTLVTSTTTDSATSAAKPDLPVDIADFLLEFDTNNSKPESLPTPPPPPEMDECSICCNEYETFATSPEFWRKLKCNHKLCLACYSNLLTTRTTMSGVTQTFLKCPFCHDLTGIQIGTCPDIRMNVTTIANSCEGYESTNTISINYVCNSEHHLNRNAYLPNNREGKEVAKLLQTACDRRLCFTIGESVTTGAKNVLVWGIHHKTALRGGVSSYGYPDPGYMDRVKLELKSYGIN